MAWFQFRIYSFKFMNKLSINNVGCLNCKLKPRNFSTQLPEIYLQNMRKLEEIFKIRPIYARLLIGKNKKLAEFDTNKIAENYSSCINAGISETTLMENPEILTHNNISSTLPLLNYFNYDNNITAPLLLLGTYKLENNTSKEQIKQKIEFISNTFDVTVNEVCKILAKRPFLISLNLDVMDKSIKVLFDYGISKQEILKDPWVLKYSVNTIDSRLKTAKENKIKPIKTWMVRAQHLIFENHIRRQSDNKLILGDNSLTEYLSERLDCSQPIARYIIAKHPALQNKSLKKMNEMIDFLLGYGFNRLQICRTPKILLHSVETCKKRLKQVEAQSMKLDTLSVLTKSKKQFEQFLESLKPEKKKKVKNK